MVTLIHTLLHFVTLFPPILSPTACVAASTRKMGVSKSHLLSVFSTCMRITQAIAAGPMHICHFKPPVYGSASSVINHAEYSYYTIL
jgi:hypothetical protein